MCDIYRGSKRNYGSLCRLRPVRRSEHGEDVPASLARPKQQRFRNASAATTVQSLTGISPPQLPHQASEYVRAKGITMAAMMPSSSMANAPYDSDAVERDLIDPDDGEL